MTKKKKLKFEFRILHAVEHNKMQYMLIKVFYNKKGQPDGWASPFDPCKSVIALEKYYEKIKEAFNKPILTEQDFAYNLRK